MNDQNVITAEEFDMLKTFHSRAGLALSVYLDLRSTPQRERVMETVRSMVRTCLKDTKQVETAWQTLQEDLDLIQIYLGTNKHSQAAGVAIFSCAQELFWRAYPLWMPVKVEAHIGAKLDMRQLLEALDRLAERSVA